MVFSEVRFKSINSDGTESEILMMMPLEVSQRIATKIIDWEYSVLGDKKFWAEYKKQLEIYEKRIESKEVRITKNPFLGSKLYDVGFSVRLYNCLNASRGKPGLLPDPGATEDRHGMRIDEYCILDLEKISISAFSKIKNVGKNTVLELVSFCEKHSIKCQA